MSVHYDIERTLADLRASLAAEAANPPDGLSAENYIYIRHPEVMVSMVRMILSEANRGTDPDKVMWALASRVALAVENDARSRADPDLPRRFQRFIVLLAGCFHASLNGDIIDGTPTKVHSERGGHA